MEELASRRVTVSSLRDREISTRSVEEAASLSVPISFAMAETGGEARDLGDRGDLEGLEEVGKMSRMRRVSAE